MQLSHCRKLLRCLLLLSWVMAPMLNAAVLPEDRMDVLYHRYDGGGMDIKGPSVLVRKSFADKVSVNANYYVDKVSAASVDVVTTASPYTEERIEKSIGLDYLSDKTLYSVGITASDERDYIGRTAFVGVSQDFFGDMTTVSLGYAQGDDEVRRRDDPDFREDLTRRSYQVGVSQVLTRNLIVGINHELISDQGYLNNPYRSVRYLTASGFAYQPEVYPRTRTSEATALRGSYYLPWRAALHGEFRWFEDSWGIDARDWSLTLVQPLSEEWVLELRTRHYRQSAADFYSDLFPFQDAQNFLARDKEMSTFRAMSFGATAGFQRRWPAMPWVDRYGVRLGLDLYRYDYRDFRDLRVSAAPGEEPLYSFDAWVTTLVFTLWY